MKWILAFAMLLMPSIALPLPVTTVQLTQSNTVMLQDDIDAAHMDTVLTAVAAKYSALPKDGLLYLVISSPGGSIDAASIMSQYLNMLPNLRMICLDCESAAGWIFEKSTTPRLVVERSRIMMHEIRMFVVTPTILKSVDTKEFVADGDKFNQVFIERMHLTSPAYLEKVSGADWVVTSSEMLRVNLADKLVEVICDPIVNLMMPRTCAGDKQ